MARALQRLAVTVLGGVAVVVGVAAFTWILLYAMRPNLFPAEPSAPAQLWEFLRSAFLHLDFDRSDTGREVTKLMREGLPADLALYAGGMLAGLALGITAGLACAVRRRSVVTRVIEAVAAVAVATPVYVFGLMCLLFFGAGIGDLDLGIPLEYVPFGESPGRWLGSIVVPWLILGLPLAGLCVRALSASAADVLDTDFIRASEARGVRRRRIVLIHVLPAAVTPMLAIASASANIFLLNMVLVERVFSVPGFLQEVSHAVGDADVPLLLALSVVSAALIVVTSILLQAVIGRLDPRARAPR